MYNLDNHRRAQEKVGRCRDSAGCGRNQRWHPCQRRAHPPRVTRPRQAAAPCRPRTAAMRGAPGPGGAQPVRPDEKGVSSATAATLRAAALKAVRGGTVYWIETDAGDGANESGSQRRPSPADAGRAWCRRSSGSVTPFRWSAQALELAGRVRAPFRWCPAPSAQRREDHDVRVAPGKVGVVGGAHTTVDVASAVGAPPRLSEDPVAHPAG
jgi:hypothetical protein